MSYMLVQMLNDMIIVLDTTDEKPDRIKKKQKSLMFSIKYKKRTPNTYTTDI